MGVSIDLNEFAVVDVETTGLFPARNDRIVEIAIIRANCRGETLDEYATLINPLRDIGPILIHGISSRDVKSAPTFSDVAGDILQRLAGTIFVAHNARFDASFIRHEMKRCDVDLPDFPYVCTMNLASRVATGLNSRRLSEVCNHFGIELEFGHSAECDARATARVLSKCLAALKERGIFTTETIGLKETVLTREAWPVLPPSGKSWRRTQAIQDRESAKSWLASLIERLPSVSDATPEVNEYMAILDRVLEDRVITSDEAALLDEVSREIGLLKEQAIWAHKRYLHDLIQIALGDGEVSEGEFRELNYVRRLLALDETVLNELLVSAPKDYVRDSSGTGTCPPEFAGKTVCFTGTLQCTINGQTIEREEAEDIATKRGLKPVDSVTKSLDLLVTSDPESMSGKAQKARRFGIRILAERVFWQKLGVQVD